MGQALNLLSQTPRRLTAGRFLFALSFGLACSLSFADDPSRPNIVLIFADDLGYCDSQLYGCDTVPTPNIQRIATDGVLCTSGYVSSPVCSPSRAGLLTGRYQQRFGHEFNPRPRGPVGKNAGLPVGEVTLANVLKDAGYATAMVGKWHLGYNPEFHPINRGFDEFFGTIDNTGYIDPMRADVRPIFPNASAGKGRPATAMRGTTPVDEPEYLTEALTREAVAFIQKNKDRPFFLYLPYNAVHGPHQATLKYYDRFPHIEDESSRLYAAMTSALDDGVGAILDTLKEDGLDQNTLVIFLSDNGAGVADYCSNEPFRLGKGTLFEGGIRVPFAMKWPGKIPGGTVFDEPVSSLDIFPTVVAAAGGQLPKDRTADGVDLLPYLDGTNLQPPHPMLFWRNGENWAARKGNWKLIHAGDRDRLYDLAQDPGEQTNRSQQHPETVNSMKSDFASWNDQLIDPLWPSMGVKALPRYSVDGVSIGWHH